MFSEAHCGVRHTLFVAALIDNQIAAILLQRLPQPQHVAVTKDGEEAFYELRFHAVDINVLIIKKFNQRLRGGHSDRGHMLFLYMLQPGSRSATWRIAKAIAGN